MYSHPPSLLSKYAHRMTDERHVNLKGISLLNTGSY